MASTPAGRDPRGSAMPSLASPTDPHGARTSILSASADPQNPFGAHAIIRMPSDGDPSNPFADPPTPPRRALSTRTAALHDAWPTAGYPLRRVASGSVAYDDQPDGAAPGAVLNPASPLTMPLSGSAADTAAYAAAGSPIGATAGRGYLDPERGYARDINNLSDTSSAAPMLHWDGPPPPSRKPSRAPFFSVPAFAVRSRRTFLFIVAVLAGLIVYMCFLTAKLHPSAAVVRAPSAAAGLQAVASHLAKAPLASPVDGTTSLAWLSAADADLLDLRPLDEGHTIDKIDHAGRVVDTGPYRGGQGAADAELAAAVASDWDAHRRYAVVFDAGSSGTRVMIYSWLDPAVAVRLNATADAQFPRIEKGTPDGVDWMHKVTPGLSSFGSRPEAVGKEHLQALLNFAGSIVPVSKWSGTPVYLFATAGLRLLSDDERRGVLSATCSAIRHAPQGFAMPDGCDRHIRMVSGEMEGLFGWLAVNYLMGMDASIPRAASQASATLPSAPETIPNDGPMAATTDMKTASPSSPQTYGFLDMGGGSTQIAFEPTTAMANDYEADLVPVKLRTLGGKDVVFRVFSTSFLGFGVNEARRRYEQDVLFKEYPIAPAHPADIPAPKDPCLPVDLVVPSRLPGYPDILGTGDLDVCLANQRPLLNKSMACTKQPCLFNGVSAPLDDFQRHRFVGISEYWYTSHELFHLTGGYSRAKYADAAQSLCAMSWSQITHDFEAGSWPRLSNLQDLQLKCFKAAWILTVLHDGFGVPRIEAAPSSPLIDASVDEAHPDPMPTALPSTPSEALPSTTLQDLSNEDDPLPTPRPSLEDTYPTEASTVLMSPPPSPPMIAEDNSQRYRRSISDSQVRREASSVPAAVATATPRAASTAPRHAVRAARASTDVAQPAPEGSPAVPAGGLLFLDEINRFSTSWTLGVVLLHVCRTITAAPAATDSVLHISPGLGSPSNKMAAAVLSEAGLTATPADVDGDAAAASMGRCAARGPADCDGRDGMLDDVLNQRSGWRRDDTSTPIVMYAIMGLVVLGAMVGMVHQLQAPVPGKSVRRPPARGWRRLFRRSLVSPSSRSGLSVGGLLSGLRADEGGAYRHPGIAEYTHQDRSFF